MSWSIRVATAADMSAVLDNYNYEVAHGTATWDLEPRSVEEQDAWLEAHQPPYIAVVAAAEDGTIVGWGSLSRYHARPGYRFTVEDTVYVLPGYQRRGVGLAILRALLAVARDRGFHVVLAKISGDNDASIALHARCGFELIGRERELGFKFDRWLDCVTMQLTLAEESRPSGTLGT